MNELPRRAVLTAGATALGLAVVGLGESSAEAAAGSAPLRAHYAKSIGKVFTAERNGRRLRVRLTHIRDLNPTTARQRPYCFTLVFTPVGPARFAEGIYLLRRDKVRSHRLFLSSVGDRRAMQAVVNRSA